MHPAAPDPWSADALRGAPFAEFPDLLDAFLEHEDWPTLDELEQIWLRANDIRTSEGKPLQLLAQQPKLRRAKPRSRSELYDVSVCMGQLPTRAHNWHDFFNVMMFAAFPNSKRELHARHRHIIEQRVPPEVLRLPGARTPEQDSLTMLDEGGVLLAVDTAEWASVEVLLDVAQHRELCALVRAGQVRPWLIGHAHAEHLAKSALAIHGSALPRAKAIVLPVGTEATRQVIDVALAERLRDPAFCAGRDGRRAVALEDLCLDLTGAG